MENLDDYSGYINNTDFVRPQKLNISSLNRIKIDDNDNEKVTLTITMTLLSCYTPNENEPNLQQRLNDNDMMTMTYDNDLVTMS